jgi:hypothetical protein
MGSIAGIIAAFAASHLGGSALGGLLASRGWMGFAGEAGKLIVQRRMQRRAEAAQSDLAAWLTAHTDDTKPPAEGGE